MDSLIALLRLHNGQRSPEPVLGRLVQHARQAVTASTAARVDGFEGVVFNTQLDLVANNRFYKASVFELVKLCFNDTSQNARQCLHCDTLPLVCFSRSERKQDDPVYVIDTFELS